MPAGRPPLPPEHHELHGTFRKDRHGDVTALRPDGLPDKPAGLGEHASALWELIVPELVRMNVAKKIDTIQLAAAAEWYERYKNCAKWLEAVDPTERDYYRMLIQTQLSWKTFDGIVSQFGLTPAARSRLRAPAAEKKSGVVARRA